MPEISTEVKESIENAIERVKQKFIRTPHIFLTEDDLRCNLYSELIKEDSLCEIIKTEDGNDSIPIHAEVRWYGENKKLKTRSDLVILDVSQLITSHNGAQFPSKGYGFRGPMAVIEIKLRRPNGPSDNRWKRDLHCDLDKIKELQTLVDAEAQYYLILFDKKSHSKIDLENPTDNHVQIHYLSKPRNH